MRQCILLSAVCTAMLVAICTVAFGAAGEDLQRAIDLYNARDYSQARNLLQGIDPSALTDQQRAIRTDYLARAQQADTQAAPPEYTVSVGRARSAAASPPIISYPSNWAQIVQRAQRYGSLQRMEDEPTRLTRQKFAQIAPEIHIDPGTTFNDAIEHIATDSGLNVYVNWPTVEMAGVSRGQEVTLPPLRNVTWRKVLELLLQQVSASLGGVTRLDWAIDAGVLTISTRDELNSQLTLRVYDIGDLLLPRQTAPRGFGSQLGTGTVGAGTGTGGAAGGGASGGSTGGASGGGLGTTP